MFLGHLESMYSTASLPVAELDLSGGSRPDQVHHIQPGQVVPHEQHAGPQAGRTFRGETDSDDGLANVKI